jgi:hypothetical protein
VSNKTFEGNPNTTWVGGDTFATQSVQPRAVPVLPNPPTGDHYLNQMRVKIDNEDRTEVIEGFCHTAAGGNWTVDDLGDGSESHPINSSDGISRGTGPIPLMALPATPTPLKLIDPTVNVDPVTGTSRHSIRFEHPLTGGGRLTYLVRINWTVTLVNQ